ncbi:hypothetical protein TREMEDRAFT_41093 [Tremella mesenterica DSM 1558]|uniref:uncharacterized protein n=1 Tax=Tremella mesenterica (strain ATCC 24925 / CBS 8224 / DSM 1558 / NBRC 9311 / NRRL Y-6157 / RJB 2259-6 / UBC 559-6) TaxID=578456 RepID=UPI00032C857D|nr:uncharacterized protein TREMEDRAFT_41093 [Tremella mesenterica DSM 1558]EIW66056.1 hypothetical protein TREMEDRAFT_41093 [Tremella mesenterica DSM 1558]
MTSLRRPSAAVRAPPPPQGSRPPADNDRRRDARKSKVGDAIKKRLSMRYVPGDQLFTPPPPLPGQGGDFLSTDPYQRHVLQVDRPSPGLGDGDDLEETGESKFGLFGSADFAQRGFGSGPTTVQDEQIRRRGATDQGMLEEWNLDELEKEGMDLNGFLRRTLAGADDDEKKRFVAALMKKKEGSAKELQRNVFKNYAEFVTISKEISTLENDMLELKELLAQWKDLPQLMGMESTLAPTLDKNGNLERRRTQRNSVADLQQLYKSQITNLWSTVEGSQKYLPIVPGRHLVFETHNFVELNAATYKAKQSVSLFLLSDLLLIAGRRRLKAAATMGIDDKERDRGRMVAERCWVLADLVVVDVKDSGDLTNALKIKRSKEVCIYRTSRPEDKKALLAAFRQVSQELSEKKRKDNEKEQERRKSIWLGDSAAGANTSSGSLATLLSPTRPLSTIGLSMADSKDLNWVDEYGDDLTMAIATRDWPEALKLVDKGNDLLRTFAGNAAAVQLLKSRIDQLKPNLITQIVHDLSDPEIRKAATVKLVSYLTKLDRNDLARDTFLKARRDVMLKRVRGIKCEGDISVYISELAVVCFTIVRHTSEWYRAAFEDNRMASGFVTWAKAQIETFADMFRRQVYAPTIDGNVAEECLKVTASHNRKLLRDVGLDFTFLLSTLLQPNPADTNPEIPSFNLPDFSDFVDTPTVGYQVQPSPFISTFDTSILRFHQTQGRDTEPLVGNTAPLSIRSPRKVREGLLTADERPSSPTPPPRSARRSPLPQGGRDELR